MIKKINKKTAVSLMLALALVIPCVTMASEETPARVPIRERILEYATTQGYDKFVTAAEKFQKFAYLHYLIIDLSENSQKLKTELNALRQTFQNNGGFSLSLKK